MGVDGDRGTLQKYKINYFTPLAVDIADVKSKLFRHRDSPLKVRHKESRLESNIGYLQNPSVSLQDT